MTDVRGPGNEGARDSMRPDAVPDGDRRTFTAGPAASSDSRTLAEAQTFRLGTRAEPGAILVDAPLRQLGRYRVLRVLGRGGMGVVYEAEQDQPRRSVALKVLGSALHGPTAHRRFEREGQILALLKHPGIAQIHDAGVVDTDVGPVPFVAMELVVGERLDAFANSRKLSVRDRIELFVRVADAVQHAHHCGVVHRDLKPGNILVTAAGAPKVLDFGVARLSEGDDASTLFTSTGEIVGTVPYMSPEQTLGDPGRVDFRSDVYALGIVLYELLTGELPYELRSVPVPEALRRVREVDPALPSRRVPALRGDLDVILGKALAKEPEHRYASVADFAADLRRHLDDQPVLARPRSLGYAAMKFARRHRAFVVGLSAVILVLLLGIAGTTFGLLRARKASADADLARNAAEKRATNLEEAATMMLGAIASTHPGSGKPTTHVADVLAGWAARLDEAFGDAPAVNVRLRNGLCYAFEGTGRLREALEQAERASAIAFSSLPPDDPTRFDARHLLAICRAATGDIEGAVRIYEDLRTAAARIFGVDDRRYEAVTADYAMNLQRLERIEEAAALLAELHERELRAHGAAALETLRRAVTLADAERLRGRRAEARALLEDACARLAVDQRPAARSLLVDAEYCRASIESFDGNTDAALAALAVARTAALETCGEDHPQIFDLLLLEARIAMDADDLPALTKVSRAMLEASEQPILSASPITAVGLYEVASALNRADRDDAARTLLERALAVGAKVPGGQRPELEARIVTLLGVVLAARGEIAAARDRFEHGVPKLAGLLGQDSADRALLVGLATQGGVLRVTEGSEAALVPMEDAVRRWARAGEAAPDFDVLGPYLDVANRLGAASRAKAFLEALLKSASAASTRTALERARARLAP